MTHLNTPFEYSSIADPNPDPLSSPLVFQHPFFPEYKNHVLYLKKSSFHQEHEEIKTNNEEEKKEEKKEVDIKKEKNDKIEVEIEEEKKDEKK